MGALEWKGESFRKFPGAVSCSLQLVGRQKTLKPIWERWEMPAASPMRAKGNCLNEEW